MQYGNSSLGRKYGWWLLLDENRIGELEYVRHDRMSQFWHQYRLTLFVEGYTCLHKSSENWYSLGVKLQNKVFTQCVVTNYVVTVRESGLIAARSLSVSLKQTYQPEPL